MTRPGGLEGRSRLVKKKSLGPDAVFLTLEASWIAERAKPGQFVMAGPDRTRDPLLLRPLAVAGVKDGRIDLLMGLKGKGTRLLAAQKEGAGIVLRGPLGNGFPRPDPGGLLLVAGGLGAPPLVFAHRFFRDRAGLELKFILGVPDKSFLPLVEHLSGLIPGLEVYSEDGCVGSLGNACTGLVREPGRVWACGPVPMYRALLDRVAPQTELLVSLEARMGCGYGGCLGCAIPTLKGNLRCCCEGPVFNAREVLWHELD